MLAKHDVEKLSIKSEIKRLESEYEVAIDGKDIHCKKCDEHGFVKQDMSNLRAGFYVKIPCECAYPQMWKM